MANSGVTFMLRNLNGNSEDDSEDIPVPTDAEAVVWMISALAFPC